MLSAMPRTSSGIVSAVFTLVDMERSRCAGQRELICRVMASAEKALSGSVPILALYQGSNFIGATICQFGDKIRRNLLFLLMILYARPK